MDTGRETKSKKRLGRAIELNGIRNAQSVKKFCLRADGISANCCHQMNHDSKSAHCFSELAFALHFRGIGAHLVAVGLLSKGDDGWTAVEQRDEEAQRPVQGGFG